MIIRRYFAAELLYPSKAHCSNLPTEVLALAWHCRRNRFQLVRSDRLHLNRARVPTSRVREWLGTPAFVLYSFDSYIHYILISYIHLIVSTCDKYFHSWLLPANRNHQGNRLLINASFKLNAVHIRRCRRRGTNRNVVPSDFPTVTGAKVIVRSHITHTLIKRKVHNSRLGAYLLLHLSGEHLKRSISRVRHRATASRGVDGEGEVAREGMRFAVHSVVAWKVEGDLEKPGQRSAETCR